MLIPGEKRPRVTRPKTSSSEVRYKGSSAGRGSGLAIAVCLPRQIKKPCGLGRFMALIESRAIGLATTSWNSSFSVRVSSVLDNLVVL